MEVVALPLTGTKRKNLSMEDKAAAMQQKADHTRACLIMKYHAAAREYAKNGFINMELWDRSEEELKQAHLNVNEGLVKKLRKFAVKPETSDGDAVPTTGPNCLKRDIGQQIHRNFMCWGSVLGVHLKMILFCIEKIAFSALNLKVLLEPGQREVARWKMLQLLEFVTGIDKEKVVGENRSVHYHAMDMSDRREARGRRGRDLPLQRDLAALWRTHGVYSLINSKGRIVISKLVVTECFDTCLDAQSADSKVTIDIQLKFSEQRAHIYVSGQKEQRSCSSFFCGLHPRWFLSHVMTYVANCQDNCNSRMDPSSLCRLRRQCVLRLKRTWDDYWTGIGTEPRERHHARARWQPDGVETRAMRATTCQTMER